MRIHVLPSTTERPITPERPINPWRSHNFQQVAFITAVIHIAFFSVFPLTPLHLVNQLHASESFMGVYAVSELAAGAVAALVTARLARRFGNRSMIAMSMAGTGISSILIALAPNLTFTLPAGAILGASWTAAGIALFAYFSENTAAEHKAQYTVAYTQVVFLATFLGPMIGTGLRNAGIHLTTIILIGAMLRLLSAALTQFHALEWVERALHLETFTR